MGQKEQGVIFMGGLLAGLQRVTFASLDLCPYLENGRPLKGGQTCPGVNLEIDYYNSLCMELPLKAVLKASTYSSCISYNFIAGCHLKRSTWI